MSGDVSCPTALPVPHTYLRGNIVRSPTESACLCISKHVLLAHPKVSNFDVPLIVQEDIVQLQVSVEEEKKTISSKCEAHKLFQQVVLITLVLCLCVVPTCWKYKGRLRDK